LIVAILQLQPTDLRDWLVDNARPAPVLVDVREPWEVQMCHIENSTTIPMNSIADRIASLDPSANTVVICHHGARSMQVAVFLERAGFNKLHNLSGGIDAWARQIDKSMVVY
jgi:rhodanese-related sulfurtransferase